jgi:hypothetical protein
MRLTPKTLFGAIVGVGLVPAVGVGMAIGASKTDWTPTTTPSTPGVIQDYGNRTKVIPTPVYPAPKQRTKTPHGRLQTEKSSSKVRVLEEVTPSEPSEEPRATANPVPSATETIKDPPPEVDHDSPQCPDDQCPLTKNSSSAS